MAADCLGAVCPTTRAACTGTAGQCLCVCLPKYLRIKTFWPEAWEASHRHQLAERPWPKSGSVSPANFTPGVAKVRIHGSSYKRPLAVISSVGSNSRERSLVLVAPNPHGLVTNATCQVPTRHRDTHEHFFTFTYQATYTYTPSCIHAPIVPCIHTYVRTYVHTYIHTCIHTYIPTYLPTYIHTYITYLPTYLPTYLHLHTCTFIYTHTHTYIHTYIHLHTYLHTYIFA